MRLDSNIRKAHSISGHISDCNSGNVEPGAYETTSGYIPIADCAIRPSTFDGGRMVANGRYVSDDRILLRPLLLFPYFDVLFFDFSGRPPLIGGWDL